jgi:hypothetical protein
MLIDNITALTDAEINETVAALTAELARRSATVNPMRVSVPYSSYNERRYGRPWIGRITAWPVGGRPEIEWGRYCGDGSGGEVEIMARPGDIIRTGQKDNRGNGGSNDWYVVDPAGTLRGIEQTEARQLYGGGK